MSTIATGRALAGVAMLVTVGVAGCAAGPASSGAVPGNGQAVTPTVSAAGASAPAVASSSTPTVASSSAPTGPGGVRNLVVSSAVRSELTTAFVAYKGISASDVAGTDPGSVYYAYDPATDTYWALAHFAVSGAASQSVQVSFQDGGADAMYMKVGAGSWQVDLAGEAPVCGYLRFFPQAVLMAWSQPTTPPVQGNGQSVC
jgi:hypothetical protein